MSEKIANFATRKFTKPDIVPFGRIIAAALFRWTTGNDARQLHNISIIR